MKAKPWHNPGSGPSPANLLEALSERREIMSKVSIVLAIASMLLGLFGLAVNLPVWAWAQNDPAKTLQESAFACNRLALTPAERKRTLMNSLPNCFP